jgi:hypothetical protein
VGALAVWYGLDIRSDDDAAVLMWAEGKGTPYALIGRSHPWLINLGLVAVFLGLALAVVMAFVDLVR